MSHYVPFPYQYLNVFYYVYLKNGFGAGARAMNLTQPTASSHIYDLEQQLGGVLLFERKPFRRTPLADMLFKDYAQPMVERLDAFHLRMRALTDGPQLRLGASDFIWQYYLLPALELVQLRCSTLRYDVHSGTRAELHAALREGKLDVAIMAVDQPPTEFPWEPLLPLPVSLFVPASSSIQDVDTLLQQVGTQRLILPDAHEAATLRLDQFLQRRNVFWPLTHVARSTTLLPMMVASGMGVGVSVAASALLNHTTLRPIALPGLEPVTVAALWHPNKVSDALKEFLRLVGKAARLLTTNNPSLPGRAITPEAALAALKAVARSSEAAALPGRRKR